MVPITRGRVRLELGVYTHQGELANNCTDICLMLHVAKLRDDRVHRLHCRLEHSRDRRQVGSVVQIARVGMLTLHGRCLAGLHQIDTSRG
jgi:hypothetical protein